MVGSLQGEAVAPTTASRAGPTTSAPGPRDATAVPTGAAVLAAPTAAPTAAASPARPGRATTSQPRARAARRIALPARSGHGRRVVYSVSRQRVWTVRQGGGVARTYRVSGRPSQPDPGMFRVFGRARHTTSALGAETMEYMVRFTHGERTGAAIGFHSIPVDRSGRPVQTVRQLGQPLSHGCIRQRLTDAAHLWRFAPVGTRVVVLA